MRRFTIKLLLFSLPIIIVLYGADVFISNNLRKANRGENSDWRDIFDGTVNSDFVIYGSSRALQQIDPETLSDTLEHSVYNLGVYAYDFRIQYLRHLLLLKYNKKPKLIIQSLDFLSFQKRPDLFDPGQFLPYMLYNNDIKKYTLPYKGYTWFDYEIPFVRYYGQIMYIHRALSLAGDHAANPPDRIKGYLSYGDHFDSAFTDAKTTLKSYHIPFDHGAIKLFDAFLSQCQKNRIKVIFVYNPEYIAGQKFVANRKQLFDIINHFSKKYDVPFYDYSTDTLCYKQMYFYNSEHLNKTGAKIFSKQFAGDLKRRDSEIMEY